MRMPAGAISAALLHRGAVCAYSSVQMVATLLGLIAAIAGRKLGWGVAALVGGVLAWAGRQLVGAVINTEAYWVERADPGDQGGITACGLAI